MAAMDTEAVVWSSLQDDAIKMLAKEPFMRNTYGEELWSKESFGAGLSWFLANKFKTPNSDDLLEWDALFSEVFSGALGAYEPHLGMASALAALDLLAISERDAACEKSLTAFLFFKGFHAIQAHRAAHLLWAHGRKYTALLIQSRVSELWGVDVHPAATIGAGLLIDHATGLVIGETAVVGSGCSFLHGVTLGGTGKEGCGDRHPKIGNNVLVGCNATLLGNVRVGDNCKIGSGTMLLKDLAPGVTVVGNPARVVGVSTDKCSGLEMDSALSGVMTPGGTRYTDEHSGFSPSVGQTHSGLRSRSKAHSGVPRSMSSAMLSSL
jgi:serine O-acetyltransferase